MQGEVNRACWPIVGGKYSFHDLNIYHVIGWLCAKADMATGSEQTELAAWLAVLLGQNENESVSVTQFSVHCGATRSEVAF